MMRIRMGDGMSTARADPTYCSYFWETASQSTARDGGSIVRDSATSQRLAGSLHRCVGSRIWRRQRRRQLLRQLIEPLMFLRRCANNPSPRRQQRAIRGPQCRTRDAQHLIRSLGHIQRHQHRGLVSRSHLRKAWPDATSRLAHRLHLGPERRHAPTGKCAGHHLGRITRDVFVHRIRCGDVVHDHTRRLCKRGHHQQTHRHWLSSRFDADLCLHAARATTGAVGGEHHAHDHHARHRTAAGRDAPHCLRHAASVATGHATVAPTVIDAGRVAFSFFARLLGPRPWWLARAFTPIWSRGIECLGPDGQADTGQQRAQSKRFHCHSLNETR